MVKIKTQVIVRREPSETLEYEIVNVEEVVTAVRGLHGLRVTLKELKTNQTFATMLWLRETVGEHSKLGAFVKALGDDTDKWIGKKIRIVSWKPRQREIELVQ